MPKLRCLPTVHQGAQRHFAIVGDHAQVAVQVAVVKDVALADEGVVILQDVSRAVDVFRLTFDFQVVIDELGVDTKSGFEQPDVFVAGSEEAFNASADTHAGFHQVGVGTSKQGKKDDKLLRLTGNGSNLRQPAGAGG